MRAAALAAAALLLAGCGAAARSSAEPGWSFAQSMPQRRSYSAAAELGGRIYVAGGMVGNTGRRLALVQRFDPRRGWQTLQPLPHPLRAASAAVLGGRLYVTGGQAAGGVTRKVEVYDGRWHAGPALPQPVFNHSTVALDWTLYVLGGVDGGERRDVFAYRPGDPGWRRVAPLPRPNHAFAAVAFRGELWAIGGRRGERVLREVWIYDPRSNRWRPGPTLPKPMELLGATAAGDKIHTVWEHTYQVYDASTGRWREEPPPQIPRHALSLFALGGRLYAVGGCVTPQLVDSQAVEVRSLEVPRS
jgi:hypothetical protein